MHDAKNMCAMHDVLAMHGLNVMHGMHAVTVMHAINCIFNLLWDNDNTCSDL